MTATTLEEKAKADQGFVHVNNMPHCRNCLFMDDGSRGILEGDVIIDFIVSTCKHGGFRVQQYSSCKYFELDPADSPAA